jgi:cold shock protein
MAAAGTRDAARRRYDFNQRRNEEKMSEQFIEGVVKHARKPNGYAFVEVDGRNDVFAHVNQIVGRGYSGFEIGQRVRFKLGHQTAANAQWRLSFSSRSSASANPTQVGAIPVTLTTAKSMQNWPRLLSCRSANGQPH